MHLIKQYCLLKTSQRTLNLYESGISLPVFPARTLKMVKKVMMSLDSSRAYDLDCIPVVVLNNCELELSYNFLICI